MSGTVLVPVYMSNFRQWPMMAYGQTGQALQTAAQKTDDQAWDVEWGTIRQPEMPRPVCFGGYNTVVVSVGQYQGMYDQQSKGAYRSVSPRSSHSQSQISTDDVSSDAMHSVTSVSTGDSHEPQPTLHDTAGVAQGAGHTAASAPEGVTACPPEPKPAVEWRRSVGSVGHEEGLCKRCAFYSKGRCRNGDACTHCHLNHEHRRSRHRRRHEQFAQVTNTEEDEEGSDGYAEEVGVAKVPSVPDEEIVESIVSGFKAVVATPESSFFASPKPSGLSPVLPGNLQVESSLVFGMITPKGTEKQPRAPTPSEGAAPTSANVEYETPEGGAFVTLFRG